ncbi:spore germination protein [Peribacillus sp. FSL H8-0477]|uniref:spore germination protein n=1 Tax=Peribacillus sp. FSL H8-0477 TaxID=2921388 RepID=UPI0030FBF023
MPFRRFKQKNTRDSNQLSSNLNQNIHTFKLAFADCSDIVFRPFLINGEKKAMMIYFVGLVDFPELDTNVLSPLMEKNESQEKDMAQWIQEKLSVAKVSAITSIEACIQEISMGNTLLLVEHEKMGAAIELVGYEKRSIEEPSSEQVVKGPRDGFTETINVNIALIRRRIRNPKLKVKTLKIGRSSQTDVSMMYISNLANESLVTEVYDRLKRIDIDGVIETQSIEELIEDHPFSPFPQILSTERPDTCAASLLEGRVVILVDGNPFVMIAPTTLLSLLQSSEDYYQRYILGSAVRLLRYFYVGISLLLPSLYVAVLSFHQEMLPTKLIISISTSREIVPFPAIVEAIIMEVTFEALREAGVRLPKQIGSAVSIAGALVVGQAAIQAGIVSPPMVMVVALTGIASFTIPRYNLGATFRLLRFPMIALAGTLGILGIMLGLLVILTHLCTLRSFGVPYLSGIAPMQKNSFKDFLIRAPWWMQSTRPHFTGKYNKFRQGPNQKPGPQQGGD